MGLSYETRQGLTILGTKSGTTITAVALTSTYTNTKIFEVAGYSELVVDISYTTGATETNNSVEIKLESSEDRTNFYQLTNESASAGTSTLTSREFTYVGASAATTYAFSYRIDVSYKYLRLSAKESGVVTNAGTVFVEGSLYGR